MAAVTYEISTTERIGDVPAGEWDALAGADNPFVEHRFLRALEESGSVGETSGWLPSYLLVHAIASGSRRLVAAAPTYLRTNSYGEYIFDWGWARAAHGAGLRYYPKVTAAVPFTPATGPRLMVHPDADVPELRRLLGEASRSLCDAIRGSSVHWLFCSEAEARALEPLGFLTRETYQFHWHNQGWPDFDTYLTTLKSKRRRELRRERRGVREAGVDISVVCGSELDPAQWEDLYRFYRTSVARKGGIPYLTEAFFLDSAPKRLADLAVVGRATRGGRAIAATLSFRKGDHLYGRYWGCTEDVPGLHFELCYYALIEYAIDQGITLFEAGAQGGHKLARGLLPQRTWSAHWIEHAGLRAAVARSIEAEREDLAAELAWLGDRSPFHPDAG